MPIIHHEIFIHAPITVCFDLARNIDVHIQTTGKTNERAVAGVTSGLIEKGQTVTWEATHLGVRQQLTAKITEMDRPYRFVDAMVKGAFHSFTHIHEFVESGTGTIMKDTFSYKSPLGVVGIVADKLFLERYMREFIVSRAEGLKKIAEENI
ncbi:ligand-binding SRPBCC domain-containing protein [Chryseomicrobium aureum]|uniref:SRPBCC family protein n=1 Tax=Chryseomicrobium aureum TaxID=1441723 RepID=UPI00195BE724|nr:SRPBCC family protein [Chryseomicrobium aureum]MBM7705750.1 ligand-binding SRPBCC domain-containing protein [Chryseomicrobium aureum]